MAASQLESRFLATEEDFDKIIASSRAMLEKDKEELQMQSDQGLLVSVLFQTHLFFYLFINISGFLKVEKSVSLFMIFLLKFIHIFILFSFVTLVLTIFII